MVGVAQLVEHQIVDLVVAGSSPVAHPPEIQPAPNGAGCYFFADLPLQFLVFY